MATVNLLPMTDPRNQQLVTWEQSLPRVPAALLPCGSSAEQGPHAAEALHSSAFGAWPHVLSLEGHVGLQRACLGPVWLSEGSAACRFRRRAPLPHRGECGTGPSLVTCWGSSQGLGGHAEQGCGLLYLTALPAL